MNLAKAFLIIALLMTPMTSMAGLKRIDVSPSTLINLNEGHSGEFMGGAITADFYMTNTFALRTTVGLTRDRYYPSV